MSKFHNIPTWVDGIKFASGKEANRYGELKLLERASQITDLERQPKFVLQEKFQRDGKMIRAITWTADFQYCEGDKIVVEDVKGGKATQTQAFGIQRRLFLRKFPEIELRIV